MVALQSNNELFDTYLQAVIGDRLSILAAQSRKRSASLSARAAALAETGWPLNGGRCRRRRLPRNQTIYARYAQQLCNGEPLFPFLIAFS